MAGAEDDLTDEERAAVIAALREKIEREWQYRMAPGLAAYLLALAKLDHSSALYLKSEAQMNPINAERGKFYYAIRCPHCDKVLPLAERSQSQSWDEGQLIQKQLKALVVCCPICTQETNIAQRTIHVLGIGRDSPFDPGGGTLPGYGV
jgi:hypothetical protein